MSSVGGAAGLPGIGFYAACKFGTPKNFVFMILDLDCPSPPLHHIESQPWKA